MKQRILAERTRTGLKSDDKYLEFLTDLDMLCRKHDVMVGVNYCEELYIVDGYDADPEGEVEFINLAKTPSDL